MILRQPPVNRNEDGWRRCSVVGVFPVGLSTCGNSNGDKINQRLLLVDLTLNGLAAASLIDFSNRWIINQHLPSNQNLLIVKLKRPKELNASRCGYPAQKGLNFIRIYTYLYTYCMYMTRCSFLSNFKCVPFNKLLQCAFEGSLFVTFKSYFLVFLSFPLKSLVLKITMIWLKMCPKIMHY